uniref:DUF305 domain-containing protein n=1 Tax=viral metagenome TaxID=1070528 RepID=A0A6C0E0W2_9ZZZZ
MINSVTNITNSLGKLYISIIMALSMAIVQVGMDNYMMKQVTWAYYPVLFILLLGFVTAYKRQLGINEREYLKEMIEHHSMALLTSEEILHKTSNDYVKKLASEIIDKQTSEINYMNDLLTRYVF